MVYFRSASMGLFQIYFRKEQAYYCTRELGNLGIVQFCDISPKKNLLKRPFTSFIVYCNELETKLIYILKEIKHAGIKIPQLTDMPHALDHNEITDMGITIKKMQVEIEELSKTCKDLEEGLWELKEMKLILSNLNMIIDDGIHTHLYPLLTRAVRNESKADMTLDLTGLHIICGTLAPEKIIGFQRVLWRITYGNIFVKQFTHTTVFESKRVEKSVFLIVVYGEKFKALVLKVCSGYAAKLYVCPKQKFDREIMMVNIISQIYDQLIALKRATEFRAEILKFASIKALPYLVIVRKMEAIYFALNSMAHDHTKKCVVAQCWIPLDNVGQVEQALRRGGKLTHSPVPPILSRIKTNQTPPTYNVTNKVLAGFQALVDSYGIACYGEINPAPFAMISFPFLFAVMFGDLGHGTIMLLFAICLILNENNLHKYVRKNEIAKIFFNGRYIILLMGIFSMYTGLIYNEVFGKGFNLFGSKWSINNLSETEVINTLDDFRLSPSTLDYAKTPYPFGIDPVWSVAKNQIMFINSYKMKISIIIGVIHMIFGICLSLINFINFKDYVSIFCEFIPKVLFICSLFVYLCLLIVMKWNIYAANNDPVHINTSERCAPSVLITFIDMVLFKATEQLSSECETYMYSGQKLVENFLITIALVSVPWLLLAKPIVRIVQFKRGTFDIDEEEGISGLLIHQSISAIEYVLGTVSHTASYLRLWALSLAHEQLSDVLWERIFVKAYFFDKIYDFVFVFVAFAIFAVLTVAILVLMEGLSAFLHTLRLHWVEFQSKFYMGDGYLFAPFSYQHILEDEYESLRPRLVARK